MRNSYKFGIEVECGVRHSKRTAIKETLSKIGWSRGTDASISFPSNNALKDDLDCVEFRGAVYKEDEASFLQFKKDIRNLWKATDIISNASCGIHVHLSGFNNKELNQLRSYEFYSYFIKEYRKHFKSKQDKARLENRYCKIYSTETDFNRITDEQLHSSGDRYYSVNYASMKKHGTVEFRLFAGTDDYKRIISYVQFLIATVNKYLIDHNQRWKTEKVKTEVTTQPKTYRTVIKI